MTGGTSFCGRAGAGLASASPFPFRPLARCSPFSTHSAFSGLAAAASASAFLPFFLGLSSSSAIDRLVVPHAPARLLAVHHAERDPRRLALVHQCDVRQVQRRLL